MDPQSSASSIPFATWVERLTQSGLVPTDNWSATVESAGGSVERLNDLLIRDRLLTRFQLNALSDGKMSSLRVGNYDLLDRLGAGGMGTVYKARHRRMKRIVALKVLSSQLSQNIVFVKRFQREVETLAALGHPNVVMAYDADEAEVGHFLVMEFVDGDDLAGHIERHGPMPTALAVDCILQAARGLAYAHSLEIVHRDVKPHNLLRDVRGVVKVTDLGLARLHHGSDEPPSGNDVTMAGGVIGTVDYMSPEQAVDSTTIDGLSDIYSLGCTLYYLLAGKPPFTGSSLMAILLQHRDGPIPSLSQLRADIPAPLDDLFRRMLAKDPRQRIARMVDVAKELEQIAASLAGGESPAAFVLGVATIGGTSTPTKVVPPQAATQAISDCTIDLSSSLSLATTSRDTTLTDPLTVVVVEPSRVQASIIKSYVQEQGAQVVASVGKGRDAVERVRESNPSAVVCSFHLPDGNGLELARQLHSAGQSASPGVVLVTSSDADHDPGSQDLPPRTTWLNKPFTAAQLHEALVRVSASSSATRLVSGSTTKIASPELQATRELPPLKPSRKQVKVLLVDDSTVARLHVKATLQGMGFVDFVEVSDGAYAIAEAARQSCQLIVTDYNMPLMDGRALVSYLKQNPATASIPIVMVTTETDPNRLEAVRQLGVLAIVEKSFPAAVVRPLLDPLFS